MEILKSLLVALSLCTDCFAVALCSGVAMRSLRWQQVVRNALVFAVIHCLFLIGGWALGNAIAPHVLKASHVIGFLLLAYVGGSMFWEGLKGKDEAGDLVTWRGLLLSCAATSIDAFAVGAARSLDGESFTHFLPLLILLFIITAAVVCTGLCGGRAIGKKAGAVAEIIGGCVLIGIGISLLL